MILGSIYNSPPPLLIYFRNFTLAVGLYQWRTGIPVCNRTVCTVRVRVLVVPYSYSRVWYRYSYWYSKLESTRTSTPICPLPKREVVRVKRVTSFIRKGIWQERCSPLTVQNLFPYI